MRTRWEFKFQACGFTFERVHRFRGSGKLKRPGEKHHAPVALEFEMEIQPTKRPPVSGADQLGTLTITLPGTPEDTEQFALSLAENAAERISLDHGTMRLDSGAVIGERISETPDEAKAIGDRPYLLRLSLVETTNLPTFKPASISGFHIDEESHGLLRQFNTAREALNPIDRYLGFFKVLEHAYAGTKHTKLLAALMASTELFEIAEAVWQGSNTEPPRPFAKAEFDDFIKLLVRLRHNCAHLRSKSGYRPGDTRVAKELEPHLPIIQQLALACVRLKTQHRK